MIRVEHGDFATRVAQHYTVKSKALWFKIIALLIPAHQSSNVVINTRGKQWNFGVYGVLKSSISNNETVVLLVVKTKAEDMGSNK